MTKLIFFGNNELNEGGDITTHADETSFIRFTDMKGKNNKKRFCFLIIALLMLNTINATQMFVTPDTADSIMLSYKAGPYKPFYAEFI